MISVFVALLLVATDGGIARPTVKLFTLPEVLDVVDIPGEQKALGVPMKLRSVRTKMKFDATQREVVKQFQAAGLYIPPARHISQTMKEPIIVGLEPATLIAYTAIFQPAKDSTTVVFGTAFLARREKTGRPDWGPVYPSARDIVLTDVELMRAASYAVREDEAKVRDFYEKVLPAGGFKKVDDDAFEKQNERIQLHYSRDKDGSVRVLMTHQVGAKQ